MPACSAPTTPVRGSAHGGTRSESSHCSRASPNALFGFHEELVRIAPHPVLTGLIRRYERMPRAVVVACGVVVLGAVTASDVSTGHAEPKVDPRIAGGQALFTPLGGVRAGPLQLVQMRAGGLCHRSSP